MDILNFSLGLFFIAIGFLVKSFPGLIAGYNTMSEEKRKNVDIKGLANFMRNTLITMGLIIILGNLLITHLEISLTTNLFFTVTVFVGVFYMVINSQKFDHNKKSKTKSILTYGIIGLSFLFMIGLFGYGNIPTDVTIDEQKINFSGMYDYTLKTNEIKKAKFLETIPAIKIKTNGYSLGKTKKGTFELEGIGKTFLLIEKNTPPFLAISKTNGERIFINLKDEYKTQEIYDHINSNTTSNK